MLDIGWATRPARGQHVCGDLVVHLDGPTQVVIALIDGLGHGPAAAAAAEAAADHIRQNGAVALDALFRGCDRAIRHTRGVAMAVLRIEPTSLLLEHAAVGDVELVAHTCEPINVLPEPGFVGVRMRKVVATRHQLHRGDRLLLHSDGVRSRPTIDHHGRGALHMAKAVLSGHARAHDDAGCVVVVV